MRDIELLRPNCDETYKWLEIINFYTADKMSTELRFETELMIGSEPSAFINMIEEIGLLDVRNKSRYSIEEIDVPVYSITIDGKFCTCLEDEYWEIKETFSSSVRKAIFKDKVKEIAETLDQHIENLKKGYPLCDNIELDLYGKYLTAEEVHGMFTHPQVSKIKYTELDGLDELDKGEAFRIESNNIIFAIADKSSNILFKARYFSLEMFEDNLNIQGEFIVIHLKASNILIEGITRTANTILCNDISNLNYVSKHIVIHQSQIHNVNFASIFTRELLVFPTRKLTLGINEQGSYDSLSNYLSKVSNSISIVIIIELMTEHLVNIKASKAILDEIFNKNLVVIDLKFRVLDIEFEDHLYNLASASTTLKQCTFYLHQDCKKVVQFINNSPHIEQFILRIGKSIEEDDEIIQQMLGKLKKKNRLALRNVNRYCKEYKYSPSFERTLNI